MSNITASTDAVPVSTVFDEFLAQEVRELVSYMRLFANLNSVNGYIRIDMEFKITTLGDIHYQPGLFAEFILRTC